MMVITGKRGKVYCFFYLAIKVENKKSKALNRIKNEAKWLKILNKHGIGPKIYFSNEKFIIMKFVRGRKLLDYFKNCSWEDNVKVVKEVLRQCRIMDKLKVDKFEMHYPVKHVIIGKKVMMIDFERCKYSLKPKNVTQFMQFISRLNFRYDKHKMKKILKKYKKNYSEESFKNIEKALGFEL